MPSYYNRVIGRLRPGAIADADDINMIQTNVSDALRAVINDHHQNDAFILGEDKNAFLLSPAPKRSGRYIDTMNLVEKNGYPLEDMDTVKKLKKVKLPYIVL